MAGNADFGAGQTVWVVSRVRGHGSCAEVAFLSAHNLIDYSLLLGIHCLDGEGDEAREVTESEASSAIVEGHERQFADAALISCGVAGRKSRSAAGV